MTGFFKELGSGIKAVAKDVSENVKVYFKRIMLGSMIKETQKNKVKMYQNLGELVYTLQSGGTIDIEQCRGMCSEITSYNTRLRELTEAARDDDLKIELLTPVPEIKDVTDEKSDEQTASDTAVCTDNEDDFAEPSTDL